MPPGRVPSSGQSSACPTSRHPALRSRECTRAGTAAPIRRRRWVRIARRPPHPSARRRGAGSPSTAPTAGSDGPCLLRRAPRADQGREGKVNQTMRSWEAPVYSETTNNPLEGRNQPCYTAKTHYHVGIQRKSTILTQRTKKEQQSTVTTYTLTERRRLAQNTRAPPAPASPGWGTPRTPPALPAPACRQRWRQRGRSCAELARSTASKPSSQSSCPFPTDLSFPWPNCPLVTD